MCKGGKGFCHSAFSSGAREFGHATRKATVRVKTNGVVGHYYERIINGNYVATKRQG
jgi:hypothetical protein